MFIYYYFYVSIIQGVRRNDISLVGKTCAQQISVRFISSVFFDTSPPLIRLCTWQSIWHLFGAKIRAEILTRAGTLRDFAHKLDIIRGMRGSEKYVVLN